jgi:hypothetical protein
VFTEDEFRRIFDAGKGQHRSRCWEAQIEPQDPVGACLTD